MSYQINVAQRLINFSLFTFHFSLFFFLPSTAFAVCPLCTVALGAGIAWAEWWGIDQIISGLWIGAFIVALIIWTMRWMAHKKIKFIGDTFLITLIYYATTIIPLYYMGVITNAKAQLWGVNQLLLGMFIGSLLFILSAFYQSVLKKHRGKAYFPFQKVLIPIKPLVLFSLLFYYNAPIKLIIALLVLTILFFIVSSILLVKRIIARDSSAISTTHGKHRHTVEYQQLIEKADQLKKQNPLDLSSDQDLTFAIMNLVSIEEHFIFTGAKTGKQEYYDLVKPIREMRKDLMTKIIQHSEGETWCLSKHLLAASMRLMEVGTKQQGIGRKQDAYNFFDKAHELYSLFWAINMKLINVGDLKKIDDYALNKQDHDPASLTSKLGKIINKIVDCCIE